MKKPILILLVLLLILFVGFLESFPKYFIVETKEGTTRPTNNEGIQEKHHGCVDNTGRKYKMGEVLYVDEYEGIFDTVCGCHFIEKKCKWQLMYDEEKTINTEGECKIQCHSKVSPKEGDPDYERDWLNDCLDECNYYTKKGLILGEETQYGLKSGNTTGKTPSDIFQSKIEKKVSSKCCALSKYQLGQIPVPSVTSCYEVMLDTSELYKKHIVINGMTFTKSHDDDGDAYMMYTGEEYKSGKGIIIGYNKNSSNIGHFRMELSNNKYTDFELNKCKNSFVFKQVIYGLGQGR